MEKEERGWWFRRRSFAFIDSYGGENRGHHFQRTCIYVWKRHDLCVKGVARKSTYIGVATLEFYILT